MFLSQRISNKKKNISQPPNMKQHTRYSHRNESEWKCTKEF